MNATIPPNILFNSSPELQEVLPHGVGLLRRGGLPVDPVQGEPGLPRDVEPGDGQRVHLLLRLRLGRALLQLLEAVLDVEGQVDEDPVGVGPDLVGPEEDVGLEVGEGLVDHVRVGGGLGHDARGSPGAARGAALDGQQGHVADGRRGRRVEGGVVRGHDGD